MTCERFAVPGTAAHLLYEYDDQGRTLRISCGDRVYLDDQGGGVRLGDLAVVGETRLPSGLLRRVSARGRAWTEEYRWDEQARPILVDGVEVRRDGEGRVVACIDRDAAWFYGWDRGRLASIEGPRRTRLITHDALGRPALVRSGGEVRPIAYDAAGRRHGAPALPATWHRDPAGRLWSITDAQGHVLVLYLWDRFTCIGRVDGRPGDPLAAVFSLDPTGTPVRVITADGVTRVPRDAYGEGLLALAGVPGLHGGAQHGGFVHYRGRALDPTLGAFAASDPFDGRARDPRRAGGYDGPLVVERQPGGAYAVCQGDPIARLDPTGEASGGWTVFYSILNLTWASQYVVGGPLFMDLVVNLLYSLVSCSCVRGGGELDPSPPINFFSKHAMHSPRTGAYGYRADALWASGWTMHLIFWESQAFYNALDRIRVFVPRDPFRPTLRGTVLECRPDGKGRFLLDSQPGQLSRSWSRAGGPAEAVVPGSRVPYFASGGFHFQLHPDDRTVGPVDGALHELEPTGDVVEGKIAQRRVLLLPGKGLGLAANDLLFLVDEASGDPELLVVRSSKEHDGKTRVRTNEDTTFVAGTKVRARELKGAGPGGVVENDRLPALGPGLDARRPAALLTYQKGAPLQIQGVAPGSTPEGVLIDRLEVQIALDSAPPALTAPIRVAVAQPGGGARRLRRDAGDAALLEFTAGQAPDVDELIAVTHGAATTAVKVTARAGENRRRIDRPLPAAFPAGTDLSWRTVTAGLVLATNGSIQGGSKVVYEPELSGQAPATGHLWLRGDDGTIAVRDVSALDWDAIALKRKAGAPALAGNHAVQRYTFDSLDREHTEVSEVTVFAQNTFVDLAGEPVQIWQLAGAAVAPAAFSFTGLALNGTIAETAALPATLPAQPRAGALAAVQGAAGVGVAVVKRVLLRVKLDRAHGLGAATLEAVLLAPSGPTYVAEQIEPGKITVRPRVQVAGLFGGEVYTEMPRFGAGELLRAMWTGGPAGGLLLRVRAVTPRGTTLEVEGGPLPAATPDLKVVRLEPTPRENRRRVAEAGVGAGAPDEVTFAVLTPSSLSVGALLGVTDGTTKTLPFEVKQILRVGFDLGPLPPAIGAAPLSLDLAPWTPVSPETHGGYPQDGVDIDLPGTGLIPGNDPAWIVRFGGGRSVRGQFHSGTVLVPAEPESGYEYTRGKAVDEHELTHTRQYAWLGPIMWGAVPWFAVEGLSELGDTDEIGFFYSDPKDAAVSTEGAARRLSIPSPGDVAFAAGRTVQVVQAGRVVDLVLGDRDAGGRFRIDAGPELDDGPARARLLNTRGGETTWNEVVGNLSLWSLGGLSTITVNGLIKGVAALIGGVMGRANSLVSPQEDDQKFFPATVPDPARPRAIRVAARPDGETIALRKYDNVLVRGQSHTHVVAVVEDGTVELQDPPTPAGPERALEVAYIAHDAPFHTIEQREFRHTVYDVIRTLYDPWGQLHLGTRRDRAGGGHEGLDGFLRVLRYAFGSHSWIGIPFLGFWFLTNGRRYIGRDTSHLAWMEQHASTESGEMYTAAGRLRHAPEYVGDIGSFWYFVGWREDDVLGLWERGQPRVAPLDRRDTFGVNRSLDPRHMPRVAAAGGSGAMPNELATTPSDRYEGLDLPDMLVEKPTANPHDAIRTIDPNGFSPSPRGWVPVPAGVQRVSGAYVAFTRPGTHRITVRNDIPFADEALEAHNDRSLSQRLFNLDVQKIFHELTIRDVEVTVGGVLVASPAHVPSASGPVDPVTEIPKITLLVTQRARVRVNPGGTRKYAAIALRPTTGDVLRVDHGGAEPVIEAQRVTGRAEPVEIARVYRYDNGYASDALARGVHLPEDLYVPVRWLDIELTDRLAVRDRVDHTQADIHAVATPITPGKTIYLMVPAAIRAGGIAPPVKTYDAGAPARRTDPAPVVAVEAVPASERDFIGDGVIYKVVFAEGDPPEHPVTFEFGVNVGTATHHAVVKAEVKLAPHFTLAGNDQVRRGDTLELTPSGGVAPDAARIVVRPPDGIAASVAAGRVRLAVGNTAALGDRQVFVTSAADATRVARRTFRVVP